jgi:hypothetical protein
MEYEKDEDGDPVSGRGTGLKYLIGISSPVSILSRRILVVLV